MPKRTSASMRPYSGSRITADRLRMRWNGTAVSGRSRHIQSAGPPTRRISILCLMDPEQKVFLCKAPKERVTERSEVDEGLQSHAQSHERHESPSPRPSPKGRGRNIERPRGPEY